MKCALLLLAIVFPPVAFAAETVAGSTAASDEIAQRAQTLRPKLVETRRDIHTHPELANREERTSRLVADRLRTLGFDEVRTNVAHHGVVAVLKGGKPGPVVAVRADMDALPINEVHDVPYKSTVPGVMHACGHDAHTSVGLGVAEILSQMRGQIHGSVKFIFQPAEEGPPVGEDGGAKLMIKEAALENPRPSAIFGLHVTPELAVGTIGYHAGPAQASLDAFDITILGKAAFPATPEKGVDAIAVAAQCITALESIRNRRISSFDPMILTIGTIHGGERRFSLPVEVRMEGCLRTLNENARNRIHDLMRESLKGVTEANGATFELRFTDVTAVVNNDPILMTQALPAIQSVLGRTNVVEVPQRLGGEDFSYYQQVVPGILFRLGCGNKAKGITAQIHSPDFDLDEDCLVVGVKVLASVVFDYLDQQSKHQGPHQSPTDPSR